jgi:microcin C transport system permease protein
VTVATDYPLHASEKKRFWLRFKRHRLGYFSLLIFVVLFGLSLMAKFISNNKPLLVQYQNEWYFPVFQSIPETAFNGILPTETDYLDPFFLEQMAEDGNFALFPPNRYKYDSLVYFSLDGRVPSPPTSRNWLGTDIYGYDIAARLLYGFRTSVSFGFALAIAGIFIGIATGAVQGYFAGKVDLFGQRLIEIWSSMPELYLLIVLASIFNSSFTLIFFLLLLFSWMQISDYVRAEFLRNRELEYVKASRALGLSNWQIITRHILPNSLTPVITFLPFRISAGIMALASLDFLGLGVVPPSPSLGNLLSQGKENLDAWWISLSTFTVLVITLLLLTFIGEALRDAMDNRLEDGLESELEEVDDDDIFATVPVAPPVPEELSKSLKINSYSVKNTQKPLPLPVPIEA